MFYTMKATIKSSYVGERNHIGWDLRYLDLKANSLLELYGQMGNLKAKYQKDQEFHDIYESDCYEDDMVLVEFGDIHQVSEVLNLDMKLLENTDGYKAYREKIATLKRERDDYQRSLIAEQEAKDAYLREKEEERNMEIYLEMKARLEA